jgi:hypothetical protein
MLRAFTKGEDIRVAGGEPVIDHNPAIDRKPCFAGEFRIRPYADRADHEIGGKDARAGQFETDSAIFAQNPFCVGAEQHLDALGLDRALEKGGRARFAHVVTLSGRPPLIPASHTCFGEAPGAALPVPQVVPPG